MSDPPKATLPWRALASLIVTLRYGVVAVWVAAVVYLTIQFPTLGEAEVGALGSLVPNDAPALQAERDASETFTPPLSRVVVVERKRGGFSLADRRHLFETTAKLETHALPGLEGIAGALPLVNTFGVEQLARERSTTAVIYLFFSPETAPGKRIALAHRLVADRLQPGFDGYVGVTGALPARTQRAETASSSLALVEILTAVLVALIVGVRFRAPGPALITLAAIALAYLAANRVVAEIGTRVGVTVPAEIEPVIVVLVFGVVTDYSIFFISRIRQRIAEGESPTAAAKAGTAELMPIIIAAALALALATGALAIAHLDFLQAFGPGMSMSVVIALLAAITFVPAAVAIGGRAVFWPRNPGREEEKRAGGLESSDEHIGRRRAWALRLATGHPWPVVVACVLLLLGCASGLVILRLTNPILTDLPKSSQPTKAYAELSKGFVPGVVAPTMVLVKGSAISENRVGLAALQRELARQPGVAEVVGPGQKPLSRRFGVVLSSSGDAARYFLIFDSDPFGATAVNQLREIRGRSPALLRSAGLERADARYAGDTALVAESIDGAITDLAKVGLLAAALIFLVLALLLRAAVAPLYMLAASFLVLLAAMGVTAWVFQRLFGYGELVYLVPIAGAVLLGSLGSDYNVFLAGRIWAEAERRPLVDAVQVAGSRAATPITIAGFVLAGSFALLAIVPMSDFRELALMMAFGLLLDAFLVRTLLVPALVTIVGPKSGWPSGRLRSRADTQDSHGAATRAG